MVAMAGDEVQPQGILALPNEILLSIFDLLPTKELLTHTPICRQIYSLIERLLRHRLQVADSLDDYSLYLECHHPSARLTAGRLFCTPLGTIGLDDGYERRCEVQYNGQLKRIHSLYTRFRPHRNEPDLQPRAKHPAGDIPGSRTYVSAGQSGKGTLSMPDDVVMDTVTVDAQELFSQLTTVAYLGQRESRRGLLFKILELGEGTIRVWRDWLSKQCESRTFSDHTTVAVYHDIPRSRGTADGKVSSSVSEEPPDPTKEPSILWLNTRDDNIGIRFKVKAQRKRPSAMPLLYTSEIEVAVSYIVQFEEVFIRTSHILLQIEKAQQQMSSDSGKAIIFGSYTGERS